jgi:plasmid stabilization system protein ParE
MYDEFDIGWSNRAGKDLLKIKAYILENASETVAQKVLFRLYNAVEPTRTQPERYPLDPRLKKLGNYRFIKVWNYKIIYEFTGNQIIVHRVIHSKQDMRRLVRSFKN